MKYAIQVQPNHHWQHSQLIARLLCDQLLLNGHDIVAVFFYGQATQIISKDNQHHWLDWNHKTTPLLVCSTLSEAIQTPNNTVDADVAENNDGLFTVTGMASWMQLSEQADKLVIIP